jgi:curved DNA-binding protein CbpA
VADRGFVDYYEVLQLSPSANEETVERVYRLLAKRYHPDNQATGDAEKFTDLREAYVVVSDPEKRASYDSQYDENRSRVWQIFEDASVYDGPEHDRRVFHGILSLLYVARRRDVRNPGLGVVYLGKMLGCPHEHLEFPIWYLKQRRWIETIESGQLAITADGVDKLADREFELRADRLLAESQPGGAGRPGGNGSEPQAATSRAASSEEAEPSPPRETVRRRAEPVDSDEEDDLPDGKDFLDEAFADEPPPRARA